MNHIITIILNSINRNANASQQEVENVALPNQSHTTKVFSQPTTNKNRRSAARQVRRCECLCSGPADGSVQHSPSINVNRFDKDTFRTPSHTTPQLRLRAQSVYDHDVEHKAISKCCVWVQLPSGSIFFFFFLIFNLIIILFQVRSGARFRFCFSSFAECRSNLLLLLSLLLLLFVVSLNENEN